MERGSSPARLGRTDALTFFSAEEVARARSYHRPLYWAGTADVAIEASVLATLVWSGAGAALDPGSLPWWGRTPAYAAIVVAAAAFASLPPSGEERTPAPGFVRAFASCPRINCGLAI